MPRKSPLIRIRTDRGVIDVYDPEVAKNIISAINPISTKREEGTRRVDLISVYERILDLVARDERVDGELVGEARRQLEELRRLRGEAGEAARRFLEAYEAYRRRREEGRPERPSPRATRRQLEYLRDLARRLAERSGRRAEEVLEEVARASGASRPEDLTREQASEAIDRLLGELSAGEGEGGEPLPEEVVRHFTYLGLDRFRCEECGAEVTGAEGALRHWREAHGEAEHAS